jgi:hypothetical protein
MTTPTDGESPSGTPSSNPASGSSGESPAALPQRSKTSIFFAAFLSFAVAIMLLTASGFLLYLAFSQRDRTPPAAEQKPPEPPPALTAAVVAAAAAEPVPETVSAPPPPPAAAALPEAPPPAPPQRSADLQAFVDAMQIAGVREAGAGSRASINGRMHGVGDRLPPSMELELIEIASRRLVLRDRNGFTYERTF